MYVGEKTASSLNSPGKTRYLHIGEREVISLNFTLYDNQFKIDQRPIENLG